MESKGITVKKEDDISEWYSQVCIKGCLADYASVKGCMIIRPNGYAIWEAIQDYFDEHIVKATGTKNAYFPIFIPESFFYKEAEHAEGFKPEVAWLDREVTGEGERLAVRPTSETIMYDAYAKWIRSHRDLPFKLNQWSNVVRWETEATKLFLRSREFLWQEGHCVYETEDECRDETILYIRLYEKLCNELLALPVIVGKKSEKEKFAGARKTYSIEGFMPDGKALQCGTSHELGQGFAKAFGISYIGKDEQTHLPWQNSWGLSTRLIGAVVMMHSDDKGLVIPPKAAMNQVAIVPIFKQENKKEVLQWAENIKNKLEGFRVDLDDREGYSPGWKFNEHELFGVPLRIEIGPKDIEEGSVILVRRDDGRKEKVTIESIAEKVKESLDAMHDSLYAKAKEHLETSIVEVDNFGSLQEEIRKGKLVYAPFCGEIDCEDHIKDEAKGVTTRCSPFDTKVKEESVCIKCGKPANDMFYFSRAY